MLYLVNKPFLAAGISEDRQIDCTKNKQLNKERLISAGSRWINHVTWYKIGRWLLDDKVSRFDNVLPYFCITKTQRKNFPVSVFEIQSQLSKIYQTS